MKPTKKLVDLFQSIFFPDGYIDQFTVERTELAEDIGYCILAKQHVLLLGEPGVAKSYTLDLVVECMKDDPTLEVFSLLLQKDTPTDELMGPRDIMALKDNRIVRAVDGFVPTCHFAYLDEFFKCSPASLNSLLKVLNERIYKNDGQWHDSPLVSGLLASNELPEREDLAAIRDRIPATHVVQNVRTPDGRKRVMEIMAKRQTDGMPAAPSLTLDDLAKMHAEVNQVDFTHAALEALDKAWEKWAQANHNPSARRIGQMIQKSKARAWAHGRTEVGTADLIICQHMAWNDPEHKDSARTIIQEFASEYTRKALEFKQGLEPILTTIDELKSKLASDPNADMSGAFKAMRDLRRIAREVKTAIQEGEQTGQDVSDLTALADRLENARKDAESAFTGADEDDD